MTCPCARSFWPSFWPRRASSRWSQRILREPLDGEPELLAAQEVVAAVTGTNGRPTRFPEFMTERLAPYVLDGDGAGDG